MDWHIILIGFPVDTEEKTVQYLVNFFGGYNITPESIEVNIISGRKAEAYIADLPQFSRYPMPAVVIMIYPPSENVNTDTVIASLAESFMRDHGERRSVPIILVVTSK